MRMCGMQGIQLRVLEQYEGTTDWWIGSMSYLANDVLNVCHKTFGRVPDLIVRSAGPVGKVSSDT